MGWGKLGGLKGGKKGDGDIHYVALYVVSPPLYSSSTPLHFLMRNLVPYAFALFTLPEWKGMALL